MTIPIKRKIKHISKFKAKYINSDYIIEQLIQNSKISDYIYTRLSVRRLGHYLIIDKVCTNSFWCCETLNQNINPIMIVTHNLAFLRADIFYNSKNLTAAGLSNGKIVIRLKPLRLLIITK